jgi:hypothetical protein
MAQEQMMQQHLKQIDLTIEGAKLPAGKYSFL